MPDTPLLNPPNLHLLHRLWRRLPTATRRAALAQTTAWLAPKPDRPLPPCQHGIAVGGELTRASGLGEGARLMLAGFQNLGIPHWPIETGLPLPGEPQPPTTTTLPPQGAPLVLHGHAPLLPAVLLRLPRRFIRGRRIVGYWAWELSVVPPAWRNATSFVHEIWTPSRFSAAAWETIAPGRVRVVPHPVSAAPPIPSALTRQDFALPTNAIIVLVSFSLASSFARKNPLAAIAAFRTAFGPRPDRLLILKVTNPAHAPNDMALLQSEIANAPNIRLETRLFPPADSHALTQNADIILSLHRSEGFGLVPAEAMFLSRPIIATDFSGTTDFLDASCAMPIPYRLVPAIDPRGVFQAPGATWAEADIQAAAAALQTLADNADLRARLGAAALAAAHQRLGTAGLAAAAQSLGFACPKQAVLF